MDFDGFSNEQKQALVDLLIFGMYLDGNLTAVEDRRIVQLLEAMDFASDDARTRFLDAAYTRTRQRGNSPEAIRGFVNQLAGVFDSADVRRRTFNLVSSILASDNEIVERERVLLNVLREEFRLRSTLP